MPRKLEVPEEPLSLYGQRKLANKMVHYGGKFHHGLGYALFYADATNAAKILDTWPELIEQYKDAPEVK